MRPTSKSLVDSGMYIVLSISTARELMCTFLHVGIRNQRDGFSNELVLKYRILEEEAPAAFHNCRRYANNRIENDHGPLKAWLRPMRGLCRDDCAQRVMVGHALVRNIRNGHYAIADSDIRPELRVKTAFDELAQMI